MVEKIREYEAQFRCAALTDQKLDEYQTVLERQRSVIYKEIQERAREKNVPNCLIRDRQDYLRVKNLMDKLEVDGLLAEAKIKDDLQSYDIKQNPKYDDFQPLREALEDKRTQGFTQRQKPVSLKHKMGTVFRNLK